MTLNKFCRDPELITEINTCVSGVTRTCIEGSRFMNYYVLKLLNGELCTSRYTIKKHI